MTMRRPCAAMHAWNMELYMVHRRPSASLRLPLLATRGLPTADALAYVLQCPSPPCINSLSPFCRAQDRLKGRHKTGFRGGGRGARDSSGPPLTIERRISNLFDPTITVRTLINEGVLFIGLALWSVIIPAMACVH